MDLIYILFIIGAIAVVILFSIVYNGLLRLDDFVIELSDLVSRTFKEYYKGQDIEPVIINNGIDLVYNKESNNPNVIKGKGFITIQTNEGNINSPITNIKEADIIASKITPIINEFILEKESKK